MSEHTYFAPSLFLNHGGGPNPVLGKESDREIAKSLRNVSKIIDLDKLKVIIIVTAHREEEIVTISSGKHHDLLFDYYNFPAESYEYEYKASGDPILAAKIHDAFQNAGIPAVMDDERGWDHGVFIPMMLINPAANIPIIQVSILKDHDARKHYDIGKVLYQFRKEGVAIFGSGLSYHNMGELRKSNVFNDGVIVNDLFDSFLNRVCTGSPEVREQIVQWDKTPQALEAHIFGEADHLMPLIVNAGAGGSGLGKKVFSDVFKNKFRLSGFMWDEP